MCNIKSCSGAEGAYRTNKFTHCTSGGCTGWAAYVYFFHLIVSHDHILLQAPLLIILSVKYAQPAYILCKALFAPAYLTISLGP